MIYLFRRLTFLAFFFFSSFTTHCYGLHLLVYKGEKGMTSLEGNLSLQDQKKAYREVLLEEDFPMCLVKKDSEDIDLGKITEKIEKGLQKINPHLTSLWVPTSLWQLFVLNYYFRDEGFRESVKELGYCCGLVDKKNSDELEAYKKYHPKSFLNPSLDSSLLMRMRNPNAQYSEVVELFQDFNSHERIAQLFLELNDAFLSFWQKYDVKNNPQSYLYLVYSFPSLEKWRTAYHFPYCFYPWKSYCDNVALLHHFLEKEKELEASLFLPKIFETERKAFQQGRFLLYRGSELYRVQTDDEKRVLLSVPIVLKNEGDYFSLPQKLENYALSYGSSLFGGVFFSTDACAARYTYENFSPYPFHIVAVGQEELLPLQNSCFLLPPLHPLAEMLAEGEFFHSHTRVAVEQSTSFIEKRCPGFFNESNCHLVDYTNFILSKNLSSYEIASRYFKTMAFHSELLNAEELCLKDKDFREEYLKMIDMVSPTFFP